MRPLSPATILAGAMLLSGAAAVEAQGRHHGRGAASHGDHHGHHGHRGWHPGGAAWGGLGLGLGFGFGIGTYYLLSPWETGYVVRPPAVFYPVPAYPPPPDSAPHAPAEPLAKAPPDPVIYPRQGQDSRQTEADRQACDRWATTQPSAMADASVFHRATLACMDGRGYTLR